MKLKAINFIAIVLALSFILHLLYISDSKSGNSDGIEPLYDIFEGKFISSDGTVLMESGEESRAGVLAFPIEYSALLGYNTYKMGKSGLRKKLGSYLYFGETVNSNGDDIYLTVNNSVQLNCFNLISSLNADASAVILSNKTGAVISLVSTKKDVILNVNTIDEDFKSISQTESSLIPEWAISRCPGSTFKIIASVPIIENKLQSFEVNDSKGEIEVNGSVIHNYNGVARGKTNLKNALRYSSNVYFVYMYTNKIFGSSLEKIARLFKLGESLELDFASLSSNFDLKINSKTEVAQTAFGQGKTLLTPVHLAMIMATVVNGGEMTEPYMIESIKQKNAVVYEHKSIQKERIVSSKTAKVLCDALNYTAKNYGIDALYAKSGTAQTPEGTQAWMVSADKDYTVVISATNIGMGGELKKLTSEIYKILEMI